MFPGTMALYLLQVILTYEKNQLAIILKAHDKLDIAEAMGYVNDQHCRNLIQLAFAANQHVGKFFSDDDPMAMDGN